ncbi:protein indc11 [Xylariaceae sp. FL0804]|nr:protein indc11 [Xylariaceae sp. FL0804]
MTAIRKVVITEFGDDLDRVLQVVDGVCPAPPPGHVQIAPAYAGFSGADVNMRRGLYPLQRRPPLTPGYALVGAVRALGDGCSSSGSGSALRVGDVVAVLTKYDAEATLVNQPEKYCIKVPDGMDLQQTTALLCDWNTAYGMVVHVARVAPGQRVFVHGISGAVGSAVAALSRLRGAAEVHGTCGDRSRAAVMMRASSSGGGSGGGGGGVDGGVDGGGGGGDGDGVKRGVVVPHAYTDRRWVDEVRSRGGAHAVFDPLGFESLDDSYAALAPGGILVAYGNNANSLGGGNNGVKEGKGEVKVKSMRPVKKVRSPVLPIVKMFARNLNVVTGCGRRTTFFGVRRESATYRPNVAALMDLVRSGAVDVPIRKVWDLEDIRQAHREWGSGGDGAIGSYLIRIAKD